jgi:hypothetical protein
MSADALKAEFLDAGASIGLLYRGVAVRIKTPHEIRRAYDSEKVMAEAAEMLAPCLKRLAEK